MSKTIAFSVLVSVFVVAGVVFTNFRINSLRNDLHDAYRHVSTEMQERGGFFGGIPVDKLHTMRVWEDGSYNIEYQDGTSERGCLPEGLCQD